jgi:hypothetical protein
MYFDHSLMFISLYIVDINDHQQGRNGLSRFMPIDAVHPIADDPYTQEHPKLGGYNTV